MIPLPPAKVIREKRKKRKQKGETDPYLKFIGSIVIIGTLVSINLHSYQNHKMEVADVWFYGVCFTAGLVLLSIKKSDSVLKSVLDFLPFVKFQKKEE